MTAQFIRELQQTRLHYDEYPYEVGVQNSEAYTSARNPIGRFITSLKKGSILDIGCGPGNILPVLGRYSTFAVGFDLSRISLRQATQVTKGSSIQLVQGNALRLPFADQSFDTVIASGSLHHTPDAQQAFSEAIRVLRSGGQIFLSLYQRSSYYFYLYYTLGSFARFCERYRATAVLINRCILLPLFVCYFFVGRFVIHRQMEIPSFTRLMNYFADQILNPVVSFHSIDEISRWAQMAGVDIVAISSSHAGALINVEIRRLEKWNQLKEQYS